MMLHTVLQRIAVLTAAAVTAAWLQGAAHAARPLSKDDVLSIRNGRFYLDGQPFCEISFNKFDLFWQLYDSLAKGHPLDASNPMVRAQDRALANLHRLGFRTLRFFALPWGPRGPESYADPQKRKWLYQALDKTCELCDRHDIRLVWSLGAGEFTDRRLVPGKGWVYGKEQLRELVADPASRNRKLLYRYLDETVRRYKSRRTVLMWEITNELNLSADIGRNRVYHGRRMPTLEQVAQFYDDVARRIKAADPLRLVNNGGSRMRPFQWHLYLGQGWIRDRFEEQFRCFKMLFADSAVDVIDIHYYPNNHGGTMIAGAGGGQERLTPEGYLRIAGRLGKPLMIGELGLQPAARSEKTVWAETPDYFESYADTRAARPWIEKTLNSVVEAGVPLSYWWCYQSDRPMDQNNPQRFDLSLERNPELLACFTEANKRLKARLASSFRPWLPVSDAQIAQLWDMTEVRKEPFNLQTVSSRKAPLFTDHRSGWMHRGDAWVAPQKPDASRSVAGGPHAAPAPGTQLLVRDFFLSSERTPAGPNRIFCALARPLAGRSPVPVLLVFHGGGGHASGALAVAIARRHPGMAAVAMDYNGQFRPGPEGKITVWRNVRREARLDLVPNLRNQPMYHYVTAARRVLDYIETQPWADPKRIGAVGISYGGWVALILAGVDPRVRCVTAVVSAGGAGFTEERAARPLRLPPPEQHLLWLRCYEPLAYVAQTKAGVFFQLCTDDMFFWLDAAARHRAALAGETGWVLRPNSNHNAGGPVVSDAAGPAFMAHALAGGPALPRIRELRVDRAGGSYSWKASGPRPITASVLYWSPGNPISPARYWIAFPARRRGDRWTAPLPPEFAGLASEAFVNVRDSAGVTVSSRLVKHPGLDPMLRPGPQWPGGQVWDVLRGRAAWRPPAPGAAKTVFQVLDGRRLRLGPGKGGAKFCLLTNSVILASGRARDSRGLEVRIHGNGHAGRLQITLLRDCNSLDQCAYAATIEYGPGTSEHEIPWRGFRLRAKSAGRAPKPRPFDGLLLAGERTSGTPITIERLALLPKK